jgi:uncharacterized membrane protein YdjX (TVP38/TMEM64 family)
VGLVIRRPVIAALAILLAVGVLLAGREAAAFIPRFADWVHGLGALGVAAFVAGYALAVVALVPGSLLTITGGALFGLSRGVVIVFVAAVLGSTAAFLIARHAARDTIVTRIGGARGGVARVVAAIDAAAAQKSFLTVLLLRLSPVFPFNMLNYLLGVTSIPLRSYVLASIGMLPGTFVFVYTGWLIGDVAAAAAGVTRPRGAAHWLLLALGLAATIGVVVLVTRLARRELQQRIGGTAAVAHDAEIAADRHTES